MDPVNIKTFQSQPNIVSSAANESQNLFQNVVKESESTIKNSPTRVITAPIPDAAPTAAEVRVSPVAAKVITCIQPKQAVPVFTPIGNMENEAVRKKMIAALESWDKYKEPEISELGPKMSQFATPPKGKELRFKRDVKVRLGISNVGLSKGWAALAKKILNGEALTSAQLSRMQKAFPNVAQNDYIKLIKGVYDDKGELQSIAFASIKGEGTKKHYWIDKFISAPWNITRELRKDLNSLLDKATSSKSLETEAIEKSVEECDISDPRIVNGRGAGTALMQQMGRDAQDKACPAIMLDSVGTSQAFYLKCGFEDRGKGEGASARMNMNVDSDPASTFQRFLKGERLSKQNL